MKQDKEGSFKLTFSRDNRTGHFLKEEPAPVPLLDAARRFSCVFLSTSVKDAAGLNHQLSAAGIRAYHAGDTREAEVLLAITSAKILLIDIDRTFEPWPEILQKLDESHPNVPKVVLTARGPDIWSLILSPISCSMLFPSRPIWATFSAPWSAPTRWHLKSTTRNARGKERCG